MVTGRPPKSIRTSITSRVVPATCEVIAASRPAKALRRVDFPAFGSPTIAASKPDRTRSALVAFLLSRFRLLRMDSKSSLTSSETSKGTSSSEKSIVTSIKDAALTRFARQSSTRRPSWPANTFCACRRCDSVSASIRSARPSTCTKSILPFSKLRRVNSPGSAIRHKPMVTSSCETALTTAKLP